jgi:hypothetical protein
VPSAVPMQLPIQPQSKLYRLLTAATCGCDIALLAPAVPVQLLLHKAIQAAYAAHLLPLAGHEAALLGLSAVPLQLPLYEAVQAVRATRLLPLAVG